MQKALRLKFQPKMRSLRLAFQLLMRHLKILLFRILIEKTISELESVFTIIMLQQFRMLVGFIFLKWSEASPFGVTAEAKAVSSTCTTITTKCSTTLICS